MKVFFSDDIGIPFHMFDATHIIITALTVFIIVLIFRKRNELKLWRYKDKPVRFTIATIMLLNMIIWDASKIWIVNNYDWTVDLPLHLCFITGYFFMFVLYTDNRALYRIVYFFTFIGPLPAMLMPDLNQWFDRFLIYQFIISHHLMLVMSLYCLFVLEYRVEKIDMLKAIIVGNILVIAITIFNNSLGTNYIMVNELPQHVVKIIPFIEEVFNPIFWLELCAAVSICVSYLPVVVLKRAESKGGVINEKG